VASTDRILIAVSDGPTPQWLESADGLARTLLARASPIHFDIARTRDELDAVFRLRATVSIEEGWRTPADLPDGLERDEYDDRAVQIAGWDDSQLAGTIRVIFPQPGFLLPVEEAFDVIVEPRGQVAGAGRVIVAKEYRGDGHRVFGGLCAALWTLMRDRGYQWIAGTATQSMVDFFERLGFECTILGESASHWGADRFPVRMAAPDPQRWAD
jgi:N-acyl-L-homoserine lactone synthetase